MPSITGECIYLEFIRRRWLQRFRVKVKDFFFLMKPVNLVPRVKVKDNNLK